MSKGEAMIRNITELMGYTLQAEDGEIGRCKDFLFDDQRWTIRYMVADTGTWLSGRKVLVSPIALGTPDREGKRFPVKLTREKIKESPPLDEDAPVSRQYEARWLDHYGWSYYWFGGGLWGPGASPTELYVKGKEKVKGKEPQPEESRLRSVKEVTGYHIQARDGEIGHLEDLLVDEVSWNFCYLVVDTRNWLPGRHALVAPAWVNSVDWAQGTVSVNLTTDAIKNSPEYDPGAPVSPDYERDLRQHYGLPIESGMGPL
jgi:hypothetical protein